MVTGQQVGLFSGPAYTIYKALTAVRLAAQLSEQGIPAVPMFWLATEDHDVAEVNHTFVFGPDHRPIQLSVDANGEIRTARGRDSDRGASGGSPARDPGAISATARKWPRWCAPLIRPVSLLAEAFRALLERLLAGRGLLFVDPLDESVRRLAAPILQEAVRQDEGLHAKLIERGKELEAAGYHAQVHVEAKTSLVFLLDGERRATLRRQNGEYASKEKLWRAEIFGGGADRPRGTIVAQCVAAAGGAGLRAANRRLRRRARGVGVYGAIAGAVSRTAGPDAGDGFAQRIHAAGRPHRQIAGSLWTHRPGVFPRRRWRARRDRAANWCLPR